MRRLRKVIQALSAGEDVVVFILCMSLCLVGMYGLYDSYKVYQQANDDSILQWKPGYESEEPDKQIVGNMVAWLTIDGTNIDYPVMQGETNYEYLNKNPYGEYSLSGSIFLDSRNSADFSDDYNLIYGHHMENNYMFGGLDKFLDEDYFKKHQTGELIVGDKTYKITFFAALNVEATDEYIFAPTTKGTEDIIKHIESTAEIFNLPEKQENSVELLALSTCKYPDTIDRTVLCGFMEQ